MGSKVGTFFLMLGAGLLLLFVLSDRAGTPDYPMLLYGAASLGFGILLKVRFRPAPPPPANRFNLFKKKPPREQGAPSGSKPFSGGTGAPQGGGQGKLGGGGAPAGRSGGAGAPYGAQGKPGGKGGAPRSESALKGPPRKGR